MRRKRPYKEWREENIRYVAARRKKIRLMAIEHLGGKCTRCGYNKYPEVLEFHHRDPSQKDFNVSSKGHSRSWERVKKKSGNNPSDPQTPFKSVVLKISLKMDSASSKRTVTSLAS